MVMWWMAKSRTLSTMVGSVSWGRWWWAVVR